MKMTPEQRKRYNKSYLSALDNALKNNHINENQYKKLKQEFLEDTKMKSDKK